MQPQLITKPALTIAGMKIRTQPMSPEIPALWGKFAPRIGTIDAIAEPHVSYGVMGRYDENMAGMDYMAGVSVENADNLPEGMTTWAIDAHTYAVFEATLPTLGETFGQVYNRWLPDSDYQAVPDFCFERYPESFNPEDPKSKMEIYIPVVEKV